MKFVSNRSFADPRGGGVQADGADQRIRAVPDGRINIEKINGPCLFQLKGTPAEYKAGLDQPIPKGWPGLHEAGAALLA